MAEVGGTEQIPGLSKLTKLKDRLRHGEKPLEWENWKRTLIGSRVDGIPEELLPQSFSVSEGLMDTFQEILPINKWGFIDKTVKSEEAQRALSGLESGRVLVVDKSGRLLVQTRNNGESELIPGGEVKLRYKPKLGQVGTLHTHTSGTMPSSVDVSQMLTKKHIIDFIVSPHRVIAIVRTNGVQTFPGLDLVSKIFIQEVGKQKRKRMSKDGIWKLDYTDLKDFGIVGYEALRSNNKFTRKN